MKFKLNRTKKNDIVLESNNLVSVQNLLFVISALMFLLCLFRFIKVDVSLFGSDYFKMPYLSPFNMGRIGDGLFAMAGSEYAPFLSVLKIFSLLYLIPIITIILFFINRIMKSIKNSYRVVMIQYIILIFGCAINFMALNILGTISKLASRNDLFEFGIKTTIASFLYGLLNLIILIIAFYASINTGIKKIEEIEAQDIFSKEAMKKTSELAKNVGSNLNKAVNTAVKATNNAINEAKKNQNTNQNVDEDLSDTIPKEETNDNVAKEEKVNDIDEIKEEVQETQEENKEEVKENLETISCNSCGTTNKIDKKFCTSCGHNLQEN